MSTHYYLLRHYLGWRPFHRYNVPLLQWVKLNTPSKPHDTPHLILQKKFGGWLVECFTSPSMVRMKNPTTLPRAGPKPTAPLWRQKSVHFSKPRRTTVEKTWETAWDDLRLKKAPPNSNWFMASLHHPIGGHASESQEPGAGASGKIMKTWENGG